MVWTCNLWCSELVLFWSCAVLILIYSETWGAEASSSPGGRGEEARVWATLQWQHRRFLVTGESPLTDSSGGPRRQGNPASNREGKRLLSVMQASSVFSETLLFRDWEESRKINGDRFMKIICPQTWSYLICRKRNLNLGGAQVNPRDTRGHIESMHMCNLRS
jgi:hypothetical protein